MAARTTMSDLIQKLRLFTNTSTNDFTVSSTTYWTDEQLQDELDKKQKKVNYQSMQAIPTYGVGGTVTYTRYQTGLADWEKEPVIQDEGGTTLTAGTATGNYAFDDNIGVVNFVDDTEGHTRYITGYVYNVEMAAAKVWEQKVALYATQFDFSTDNHSIKRSQVLIQCREMVKYYQSRAGVTQIEMVRSDDVI
jgi:hypothetical protein